MAEKRRQRDPELFQRVSEMAEHIGLTGREKTEYVHEHMTRGGYRAEPHYVPDDDDDDDRPAFFKGSSSRSSGGRRDDDRDDKKASGGWF